MRIRRLELSGFKSFMERTVLELPAGITGIVGPNGCGKSNIVDAIRWVIGEQSAKHLRGDAMEDVICSGNADTGPLGMAEVSLLLSREEDELSATQSQEGDEAGGLPAEFLKASEILVTRRYFRSGESEYLINRVPCRLKDVTEFFLGTGVGTKAYAIIEQGRIGQIVSAKPAELRLFIEEAAGVTRFRARRLAAERKLARTRENLLRVQDVLRELERQKALLERQARRAEEYHRVRDELRELDLEVMSSRFAQWTHAAEEIEAQIAEVRAREEGLQDEIRGRLDATADARARRIAVEQAMERLEEQLTDERVGAGEAAARVAGLSERIEELTRRVAGSQRLTTELCDRLVRLDEGLEALRQDAERLLADEVATKAAQDEAEERLGRLAGEAPPLEAGVERAKDAVVEAVGEESRIRALLIAVRQRRTDIESRRHRVGEEQQQLARRVAANVQETSSIRERWEQLGVEERATAERRDGVAEALAQDRGHVAVCEADLEVVRTSLAQVRSRRESLEELQVRHEGCTRGVAAVLSRSDADAVLLADVLHVPATLERAVAAALGARLAQPVVEGTEVAQELVRWLATNGGGSATILPRNSAGRPPALVGGGRRLIHEIEVDARYRPLLESLLGGVLVADDMGAAAALWQAHGRQMAVVTLTGEAIDGVGAVSGGSEAPLEETLLARARQLRELGVLEELAANEVARVQQCVLRARDVVAERQSMLTTLEEHLHAVRLERLGTEKDRERLEQEHRQLAAELEAWALEAGGLEGADSEAAAEVSTLEGQAADAQRCLIARRSELEALQRQLVCWRRSYEEAEEARTSTAVTAAGCMERRRAVEGELRRQSEARADVAARLAEAERERRELLQAAETSAQEREEAQGQQKACESRAADIARERDRCRAELGASEAALTADDELLQTARSALDECRDRRGRDEIALTERRLAVDHLLQQLAERYDLGVDALRRVSSSEDESEEKAQRVERLRVRLVQLGDVNPGAVRELAELNERHQFLAAQRDDLEGSLDDLRRTISKLVRTSHERFEETFAAANDRLAEVFPKLFPEGKARLQLTAVEGDDDPGVEIVVQPAGKKLQHLGLLSGGEKALTATALVLALFLIRPTPFCLLDEVDAPLDEANIGRFNQVIREMAENCQFVLITHNRRTMEAADTLYGITMEQPGVSKVVSVRLREAA